MDTNQAIEKLSQNVAKFVHHTGKVLPTDVADKLEELSQKETNERAKLIYETMKENQELADDLDRPSCQDTGAIQYYVKVGSNFPYKDQVKEALVEATKLVTKNGPLRHNAVETFDEYNTGNNVGKGLPTVSWENVENDTNLEIYTYMSGGGCSLPGQAKTLMPGEGYEGAVEFVLDIMTSYGLNACPPLLLGIGIGTSIDVAASLSKKALFRPVGTHNENENAKKMEMLIEKGVNDLGIGPQGMGGDYSLMGVNIENAARHPSVISVALSVGCWSHRKGHIKFDKDLNYEILSHEEVNLDA